METAYTNAWNALTETDDMEIGDLTSIYGFEINQYTWNMYFYLADQLIYFYKKDGNMSKVINLYGDLAELYRGTSEGYFSVFRGVPLLNVKYHPAYIGSFFR